MRARDTHNITITTVFFYTYVGHHRLERRRLERRRLEHRRLEHRRLEHRRLEHRRLPHAADASSATLPREHRRLERRRLVCRSLERRRLVHRRCCESRRESIVTRRGYANSGRTRLWHHHRACGRVMCHVRRLLELLLHLAAIGGALERQSIAEGLERADERQCPRGDDSYCSEHCVVGEHGLSGSGRRGFMASCERDRECAAQMRPLCS